MTTHGTASAAAEPYFPIPGRSQRAASDVNTLNDSEIKSTRAETIGSHSASRVPNILRSSSSSDFSFSYLAISLSNHSIFPPSILQPLAAYLLLRLPRHRLRNDSASYSHLPPVSTHIHFPDDFALERHFVSQVANKIRKSLV